MTVKEIARRAGVTIGTVDRVLHDRGRVSPETAERVRRIVAETGYSPNLHARQLATARSYRIAVLTPRPEQDGGFWDLPRQGMERAAAELAPFHVSVAGSTFDRHSPDSFREQAGRALADRPDGLVVAPVLPGPAAELAGRVPPEVPCAFFDSDLPGARRITFIGQDSHRSGLLAARLMRLLVPDGGRVAVVQSVSRDYHIRERIRGFLDGFPDGRKPDVWEEELLEDERVCARFLDGRLAAAPDPAGLFVVNASGHRVAEYLADRFPRGSPLRLIGYDLTPANRAALAAGFMDFLISQRPEEQAWRAVYAVYRKVVLGQDPPERTLMPLDIISRENAEYYR